MKKLIMILLSVLLLLTTSACKKEAEPVDTKSQSGIRTSGKWEYVLLEDGTAEIVSYNEWEKELIVPHEIDGFTVTSIKDSTFDHNASLTFIFLPRSVTNIEANPFAYCRNLTRIEINQDHPRLAIIDGVLFDKTEKRLICFPRALTASSYDVPQGIRIIGKRAFYGCSALKSIMLPDSVTSIEDSAFSECTALRSITLPESVTSIGNYLFNGCSSLNSITLPNSMTSIGDVMFSGCALTSITLPDSITSIGNSAFNGCDALKSITLPDSVTSIGNDVFSGCSALTNITLPDSVTSIGDYAFRKCTALKSITLPNSLEHIGDYAFEWCNDLTSITLPDSLTSIGANPFVYCYDLTDIIISPEHPTLEIVDGVLFDKAEKRLVCYPPQTRSQQLCCSAGNPHHRGWSVLWQRPEEHHAAGLCNEHRE